jgi:hypothetical protein
MAGKKEDFELSLGVRWYARRVLFLPLDTNKIGVKREE